MKKITNIYELKENETKEMALMVTGMEDKTTRTGNPYVNVSLFDGLKTIQVNFFDKTSEMLRGEGIDGGIILKLNLTKTEKGFYNQNGYWINDDPDITEADFRHMAPINPNEIYGWLIEKVKSVDTNPDGTGPYKSLAHLTLELLQENEDEFKRSSAAVSMHHNFLSGLLYHSGRMVLLALKVCEAYPSLDKELLVCGTALHDIAKICCYDTNEIGNTEVTVKGRLLDHAFIGMEMVVKASEKDHYNPEKIMMLMHMIASHHGKKEWGAITPPAFPEAAMLHLIDMIDSHMNMFEEAYKGQEAGTISAGRVLGLENSSIYKPLYPEA